MSDTKGTDWMYNPNGEMNKEEYLLGKAIGKNFENEGTMGQINAVEYDCAPPSIFASQAAHQVDLQRKLLEDPLVSIKKRELEDRRKILDNPVKMKALQEHIEELKKQRKKKKKSRKRSDSDESDTDLDLKLLNKIKKMEEGGDASSSEEGSDSENENSSRGSQRRKNNTHRQRSRSTHKKRLHDSESRGKRRSPSRSPVHNRKQYDRYKTEKERSRKRLSPVSPRNKKYSQRKRYSSESDNDSILRRKYSPRNRSPRRRSPRYSPQRSKASSRTEQKRSSDYSPTIPKKKHQYRSDSSRSPSPARNKGGLEMNKNYRKRSPVNKPSQVLTKTHMKTSEKKSGMSEAEKQAKLAEMVSNAAWRDEQRTSRVKKYREGIEKEEKEANEEHDKEFLNRELKRAHENLTVEGRITANKYKIQRGYGDMDKNFARR